MNKYNRLFMLIVSFICILTAMSCSADNRDKIQTKNINNDMFTTVPGDIVNDVSPLLIPFDLDEIINNSDSIVMGKVIDIQTSKEGIDIVMVPDGKPILYTDVILQVEKYLSGEPQFDKIAIRVLGGRIGNNVFIGNDASFSAGENVLLFLFRESHYQLTPIPENIAPEAYFKVVRLFQGKFSVNGDLATNAEGVSLTISQIEGKISQIIE